jgi:hypothetical protein
MDDERGRAWLLLAQVEQVRDRIHEVAHAIEERVRHILQKYSLTRDEPG